MTISRRVMLGVLAAGGVSAATYGGFRFMRGSDGEKIASGARQLQIPPLDNGVMKAGVRNYDLRLQTGISSFFDGMKTPTYGINGDYLGPTLKLTVGETVQMNVTNALGKASTLHWHGMHLPAKADGGPHQIIENGSSWHPSFEVKQKAATLWYHSHQFHKTGEQVYMGLAGLILIEDELSKKLDLPQDYGVDDIPLVLQDRRFNNDGSFDYRLSRHDQMMGMMGNNLLVNGTPNPYMIAKTNLLRLRILNGSNARSYMLKFNDGRQFQQIASDGGFLEKPLNLNSVRLSPGERAEIIVDVSDGKTIRLEDHSTGAALFNVLEIRPDEMRKKSLIIPPVLTKLDAINTDIVVKTRKFSLSMGGMMGMMGGGNDSMSINGRTMDMSRIDEVVKRGDTEIWLIDNPSNLDHPFHIHDVQFRTLDRNGRPPAPNEMGLKDTVLVPAGGQVRVLLKFEDYVDAEIPYMYHCHILEHEDAGMMGQFSVVA